MGGEILPGIALLIRNIGHEFAIFVLQVVMASATMKWNICSCLGYLPEKVSETFGREVLNGGENARSWES